ncbi:hypothetical protein SAY87_001451 [Trapa incisa]|uniref:Uncharacterized protein n=1 Tax=Trapa incisa TaxID=236973 RepID=A0AAN7GD80_9MYRT|nr:hypothetical protein SAY87_001451 [Trapa incisa]
MGAAEQPHHNHHRHLMSFNLHGHGHERQRKELRGAPRGCIGVMVGRGRSRRGSSYR